MANGQSTVFFDNVTSARIDGDVVKVQPFQLDADGAPEPSGLLIMTRWAATLLCADLYHTLKKQPAKANKAKVLQFKAAERKLAKEPGFK